MATVLVVDDNTTMVEMLSTALTILGHSPLGAYSGEQALDIVASQKPDVLLLDLTMPGMDGYETLRRVRAMPQGEDLPVLILSAVSEAGLEEKIAMAGGNACLSKPIEMKTLAHAIALHLKDNGHKKAPT